MEAWDGRCSGLVGGGTPKRVKAHCCISYERAVSVQAASRGECRAQHLFVRVVGYVVTGHEVERCKDENGHDQVVVQFSIAP